MASRAVTPPSPAPYPPTLVGTATTGAGSRPPTTLASAPSMPATTTMASAACSSSRWASSRCSPATPASATRAAPNPKARRVDWHSSATTRSAVPAVTTTTASGGPAPAATPPWSRVTDAARVGGQHGGDLLAVARLSTTGGHPDPGPVSPPARSSPTIPHALGGTLSWTIDGLRQPLPERPVVVDHGVAELREGQPAQPAHHLVGVDGSGGRTRSSSYRRADSSITALSCPPMTGAVSPQATIAFLGPSGTFTEEALRSEPGLAKAQLRPLPSFVHVLAAVTDGTRRLRVRGPRELHRGHRVHRPRPAGLRARPRSSSARSSCPSPRTCWRRRGREVPDIRRIVSFPHATGQCRAWLTANLPDVEEVAARSTAEAVAPGRRRAASQATAAIGTGAGRRALRTGGAGPRHRGPGGQLDPVRAGGPARGRHTRADGT